MVEQNTLDTVFHALSDPTRRAMLQRLTTGERSIGDLAAPFQMTFANASKHLKTLENAGLIMRRIEGRTHMCRLNAAPLGGAVEWLRHYEAFWNERLDALERELKKDEGKTS
jgi:DNA-binding transcriptional ArsR family regulator